MVRVVTESSGMQPIADRASEKALDIADRASESARQAAEAARARIQDGYGRARAATEDLAARGRVQADNLARVSADAIEKGKVQASKANSKLQDVAKKQPMALVAGAAALGALLGSLLPKRKD